MRSIGAFFVWTQNSQTNKLFYFCVCEREFFASLSLSLFFFVFFVDTLSFVVCSRQHNIVTRSAQKQHHHLRFFVVRDERSNSIFGVCAEKTRASGFGVFFMSFRAATGVRFDSSVVLSSASRHHRHRLGASCSFFTSSFPLLCERKKEKGRAPAKKTTGGGFWRRLISSVVEKSLLGERVYQSRSCFERERDFSSNVRNQSSSFGLFFFFFFFFFSLLKLVVVVFYVVVEKKGRRRW